MNQEIKKSLVRINRALSSMPFGAGVSFQYLDTSAEHAEATIVEAAACNLEKLRDVIRQHADSCIINQTELRDLQTAIRAVRKVFGTGV